MNKILDLINHLKNLFFYSTVKSGSKPEHTKESKGVEGVMSLEERFKRVKSSGNFNYSLAQNIVSDLLRRNGVKHDKTEVLSKEFFDLLSQEMQEKVVLRLEQFFPPLSAADLARRIKL